MQPQAPSPAHPAIPGPQPSRTRPPWAPSHPNLVVPGLGVTAQAAARGVGAGLVLQVDLIAGLCARRVVHEPWGEGCWGRVPGHPPCPLRGALQGPRGPSAEWGGGPVGGCAVRSVWVAQGCGTAHLTCPSQLGGLGQGVPPFALGAFQRLCSAGGWPLPPQGSSAGLRAPRPTPPSLGLAAPHQLSSGLGRGADAPASARSPAILELSLSSRLQPTWGTRHLSSRVPPPLPPHPQSQG